MKHILIIEDDKDIAALEKDYLDANGFAVSIAVRFTGCKGRYFFLHRPNKSRIFALPQRGRRPKRKTDSDD